MTGCLIKLGEVGSALALIALVPIVAVGLVLAGIGSIQQASATKVVAYEQTKQVGIEWGARENIAQINADAQRDTSVAYLGHRVLSDAEFLVWLTACLLAVAFVVYVVCELRRRGLIEWRW